MTENDENQTEERGLLDLVVEMTNGEFPDHLLAEALSGTLLKDTADKIIAAATPDQLERVRNDLARMDKAAEEEIRQLQADGEGVDRHTPGSGPVQK